VKKIWIVAEVRGWFSAYQLVLSIEVDEPFWFLLQNDPFNKFFNTKLYPRFAISNPNASPHV
jgi:hypothetical protein